MKLSTTFSIVSACIFALVFSLGFIASAVGSSAAEQNQVQQKISA